MILKKILFGFNQNTDKTIEEMILKKYREKYEKDFNYDSEYYLLGIAKSLKQQEYNVLILNEALEATNKVTTDFLDELTDKYPSLEIIYLIENEHNKKYIQTLFNLGIYNVLFNEDLAVENIVELIENPRTKKEAKTYMDIDEIEHIEYKENLQEIPEEQLEQIIINLQKTEEENLSETYDEINRQYNEKQMLFLITILSERILEKLVRSKNKNFLKLYNQRLKAEKEYDKEEQRAETKERIVTKIEKQYIQSIPTDYNKIVAFAGSGKTGTTTLINLIAKEFVRNKKRVAVLDLTKNNTMFYLNCWGGTELSEKERNSLEQLNKNNNHPIIIEENYSLYTQIDNDLPEEKFDFINAIEQIRYDNDIVLIDMDINSSYKWLKFGITGLYIVQDLNILNILTIKNYLKEITRGGVNNKKITLIINKFIDCKVKTNDILTMITEPIPDMELDTDSNKVDINKEVFIVDFNMENYENLLNSNMYLPNEPEIKKETWEQVNKICSHIYPLDNEKKEKQGFSIKKIFGIK